MEFEEPKFAKSVVQEEWIPTQREYEKEMDRSESNIGRYTVGFRHYENYNNYKKKFPGASMEDYANDMNSEMTFNEFLLLA